MNRKFDIMDWIAYSLVILIFFLCVGGIIFQERIYDKLLDTAFAGLCVYVIYKSREVKK